jgi:hypothetical protein
VSNQLNTVMKVLTVIATVFMPLTFITGLYGSERRPFRTSVSAAREMFWMLMGLMMGVVIACWGYFHKRGLDLTIGRPSILRLSKTWPRIHRLPPTSPTKSPPVKSSSAPPRSVKELVENALDAGPGGSPSRWRFGGRS